MLISAPAVSCRWVSLTTSEENFRNVHVRPFSVRHHPRIMTLSLAPRSSVMIFIIVCSRRRKVWGRPLAELINVFSGKSFCSAASIVLVINNGFWHLLLTKIYSSALVIWGILSLVDFFLKKCAAKFGEKLKKLFCVKALFSSGLV